MILLSLMSAIISCVSNIMTLLSLMGEGGKFRGGKEIQGRKRNSRGGGGAIPGCPPSPPCINPCLEWVCQDCSLEI